MWSLYTGQLPYLLNGADVQPNKNFPAFPQGAHPQYTSLACSCLWRDPHERPSFTDIAHSLLAIFGHDWELDEGESSTTTTTATATAEGPLHQPYAARSAGWVQASTTTAAGEMLTSGSVVATACLLQPEACPPCPMSGSVADVWDRMATLDFSVSRSIMASSFLGSGHHGSGYHASGHYASSHHAASLEQQPSQYQ